MPLRYQNGLRYQSGTFESPSESLRPFYLVLLGFIAFYWVLLDYTGFYRVLLGFVEFYWVLLGFPVLNLDILGVD